MLTPAPVLGGEPTPEGGMAGGKRHGASVKQLKRVLKKAGLKTTGRKAALTRRAKKAGLKMRGGEDEVTKVPGEGMGPTGTPGGRRRGRKSRSRGKLGLMGY